MNVPCIDKAIEIRISEDGVLGLVGERLASQNDYEFARFGGHPSDPLLFEILQPGQEVVLYEGTYCIGDELDLLMDEDAWDRRPDYE